MATTRTHIPKLPPGFIVLRIFQLVAAVAVFGVSMWFMVNFLDISGITGLATALMTIIVLIWEIAAESCAPRAYNYWAVLAMEIFLFLNWIDSLAWFVLESCLLEPSAWEDVCSDYYNYSTQTYETTCTSESNSSNTLRTMIYLGAGLTGVLFILYLTSLIIVSTIITKHRAAGGHNTIGSAPPSSAPFLGIQPLPYNTYPTYPPNGYSSYLSYPAQTSVQHGPDLQEQNISLQKQYMQLQQQHVELQRHSRMETLTPQS